ncbi:MAG: DUF4186 family protein [Candidatus Nanohaloarchaea archaeon]
MRKLKLPDRGKDRPRLGEKDIQMIRDLGVSTMKDQARQIVEMKLKEQPENDGFQTPSAGNPVYRAMHACHVDSRKNLSQTHRIPAGRDLKEDEIDAVVNLIVRWIVREYNFFIEEKEEQQRSLSEFSKTA